MSSDTPDTPSSSVGSILVRAHVPISIDDEMGSGEDQGSKGADKGVFSLDFAKDQTITRWATGSFKGETKADLGSAFCDR
ncbi:hypothetical protein MRB53_003433 [Persea americana]|uniref:Uncharacterized protein n=1 Tax=Persea americana TaxID=3435 RepID=A0ACC2MXE7_PERAE|nr:hypothetical protein MRB53_003433 [Persea americana]